MRAHHARGGGHRDCHQLGTFDGDEAAKAHDRLARELHGPFARLNFPPQDPSSD